MGDDVDFRDFFYFNDILNGNNAMILFTFNKQMGKIIYTLNLNTFF